MLRHMENGLKASMWFSHTLYFMLPEDHCKKNSSNWDCGFAKSRRSWLSSKTLQCSVPLENATSQDFNVGFAFFFPQQAVFETKKPIASPAPFWSLDEAKALSSDITKILWPAGDLAKTFKMNPNDGYLRRIVSRRFIISMHFGYQNGLQCVCLFFWRVW